MGGSSFCSQCGAPTTSLTDICNKCGAPVVKAVKERTWMPTTAGILSIIAGTIALVIGVLVATVGGVIGAFFGIIWPSVFGAPLIVAGIIAITGGICALQRKIWGLALIGSICALLGPWFILGVLATIFVSLGKGEFE